MTSTTAYTSDSYASKYLPDKCFYQSDARIFHRGGFTYDPVLSIQGAAFANQVLTLAVQLKSGAAAALSVTVVADGLVRLKFWEGDAQFDEQSVMLRPLPAQSPTATFIETAAHYELRLPAHTLRFQKSPFAFVVENARQTTILELETEQVAGDFVTAPLGFRRSAQDAEPFLSWRIHNTDRFFGLGEKWNTVEKSATRATIWAADTGGTNTTDLSYKSVPVLMSTAGWGLMLHSSFRSFWEIGSFSYTAGSLLTEAPALDLFLWFGADLKALLSQYTDLTGKPQMPPRWALGMWMSRCAYHDRAQVEEVLRRLRAEHIPCDVVHLDPPWMQTHYYFILNVDACDFVWNDAAWPEHETMLHAWKAQGFDICFWINPYLPEGTPIYDEAQAHGYMLKTADGGIARLEHGQPVGSVDFTNPAAKAWWKDHLKRLLREGASVFKPDYGDRIAEEAIFFNGRTGKELHNLYLFLYTEAAFEALKEERGENLVWRRAGYIGSQRYPGTWAGDTQVSWEAFRCCLRGGLSAGLTGEAFWASDIGGFVGPQPSPELYIRWAQFGMFSSLARFHGTSPREPWEYGDDALRIVKHYTRLRYLLIPYLLAAAQESVATGLPIMRHTFLEFPDEPNVHTLDEQYLLGADLLVAPILNAGETTRNVYFPQGTWYALEDEGVSVTGGGFAKVNAPLERIPVFVRAGAVLPRYLTPPPHLKVPAATHLRIDVYPGATDRTLRFTEVDHDITIAYRFADGQGTLAIQAAPMTFTIRLIGVQAQTVSTDAGTLSWQAQAGVTEITLQTEQPTTVTFHVY